MKKIKRTRSRLTVADKLRIVLAEEIPPGEMADVIAVLFEFMQREQEKAGKRDLLITQAIAAGVA